MSEATETVERALVFYDASGQRQASAQRCLDMCISAVDEALVQVDLALRRTGPSLFVIFRLDAAHTTDGHHAAITNAGDHAGARGVPLFELEYQERGAFLSRFAECELQRLGLAPAEALEAFDALFASLNERRAEVRHPVEAPAVVTAGDHRIAGALQNLSAGGALFTPSQSPPMLHQSVQLEAKLPAGDVKAAAKVVNVGEKGVSLQFAPAARPEVEALLPTPGRATGERVGPYEVLGRLGAGATGEVHFARVTEGKLSGQVVALKRLDKHRARAPGAVRAFEAEAATLARLKHPNIVRVLDSGVYDGQHCLVTELVEGFDLSQLIKRHRARNQQLPIEVACYLVKVLLDALAVVHEVRDTSPARLALVHADVSPHNVFVSKTGAIKLGDFGLSGHSGERASWKQRRLTYLAPEALDDVFSPSVDLWAAGVMLYELLTLEPPFSGDSVEAVTGAIRTAREKPLRERRAECSGPLEALLRSMLEKDPKQRLPSAQAVSAALSVHFHPVRAPRQLPDVLK
ncbi:MAG: protein kinase [Myxococcaceae bacterium]|nr:protein kinase [Myxococcaceae bacterium]